MAEKNNGEQKRGGLITKVVGAAVLVVVVLLIIFIGPKDRAADIPVDTEVEADTALTAVQPVVAGDYQYEFSGVRWVFDTESPEVAGTDQTWLKMEFADFTRNGNAISFGRPYKLGVHPGTCREVDFIDTTAEAGIPFAYAVCESLDTKREFVVLQESENVVVRMRDTSDGVWKEWYKIDVTEIVR